MNSMGLFPKKWTETQQGTCLGMSPIEVSALTLGLIVTMKLITLPAPSGRVLVVATGGTALLGIPTILSLIKGIRAYLNKNIPPAPPPLSNEESLRQKTKGFFYRYLLSQQSARKPKKKWDESQFDSRAERMTQIYLAEEKRIHQQPAHVRAAFIAKHVDLLVQNLRCTENKAMKIAPYYDYLEHESNYVGKFKDEITRRLVNVFLIHANIDVVETEVLMENYLPKLRAIADELAIETGGYGKKLVRPNGKYSFYHRVWTRFHTNYADELPDALFSRN